MTTDMDAKFLGLRTAIYQVSDLEKAKKWYAGVLGQDPYFDEPFYVGFDVGGYELGLLPDESRSGKGEGGTTAYWGVDDAQAAFDHLLKSRSHVAKLCRRRRRRDKGGRCARPLRQFVRRHRESALQTLSRTANAGFSWIGIARLFSTGAVECSGRTERGK